MMRIGLFGLGRLGSAIVEAAGDDVSIDWAVDPAAGDRRPGGVGAEATVEVDAAIDASLAEAVPEHVDWARESGVPLVIGATGWEIPDLEERVGERTGVVVAPNFSLTVALLRRLAAVLGGFAAQRPDRDPYVLEQHHTAKRDSPSGTAIMLAEAILEACPRKSRWVEGGPVEADEISVGVSRAGTVMGMHAVGIDSPAERLEIRHQTRSRAVFAQGALTAARWVVGKTGVHRFDEVVAELLDPLFDSPREPTPR